MRKRILFVVLVCVVILCWWTNNKVVRHVSLIDYFKLKENCTYVYRQHEGIEEQEVSITVKNIHNKGDDSFFSWEWAGKYNDRIQKYKLNRQGLYLVENKHLVGTIPLKTYRIFEPPMLMVPGDQKALQMVSTMQKMYDHDMNFLEGETINAVINFVGFEDVSVPAGDYHDTMHVFVTTDYVCPEKYSKGSYQRHTYDLWIAKGTGVVKFIHAFMPFVFIDFYRPEQKEINNRYMNTFVEFFELKEIIMPPK